MVDSICHEIRQQKNYLEGEALETIYFGGGTPSLLSEGELTKIFDAVHQSFSVKEKAEITLEANPDDLNFEKLRVLKRIGVNRLSIGVQSFDREVLHFLNRAHSPQQAVESISLSREVGFSNISLDLIYAIPGQNDTLWRQNIEQALGLSPEHISAYSLTIEEKTVFGNWQKKGKLKGEKDEVAAGQMEILMDLLNGAGYQHYEISNFAKPGFHSRHNTSYWEQKKYLGVGPSAHSYNGDTRQFNIANNSLYIKSIKKGTIPFESETLSRANKINEYLLTTLRTMWGCNIDFLKSDLHFDLLKERKEQLDQYFSLAIIERKENRLVLTRKGKLFADKIASELFEDE